MKRMKSILSAVVLSTALFAGHPSLEIYGWASPWASEFPSEQQIAHLTHLVCYSVYPNTTSGKVLTDFDEAALDSLVNMAHRNDTKVLISFGSGGGKIGEPMLNTPGYQTKVVSGIMDLIEKYNFDGFDNAWEPAFTYSEPEKYEELLAQRAVWNGFNKEIRDSLDGRFGTGSKEFTVTVLATNYQYFQNPIYNRDAQPYPDSCWLNADRVMLMSYGNIQQSHGSYREMVNSIDHWVDAGMPKKVIIPGFSFDASTAWVDNTLSNGTVIRASLPYSDVIKSRPDLPLDQDTVIFTYYDTIGSTVDTVNALYGFSGVMSTRKKLDYIYEEGFPGSMFWQIGTDAPLSSPHSLLREISSEEPFVETVSMLKPFSLVEVENSNFTLNYLLSEYFSCSGGTLKYTVSSPKQYHTEISGDTLIIHGDINADIGVTTLNVTAFNSNNEKDKKSTNLSILCYSKGTTTIDTVSSANLVLSETWIPWGKSPQKTSQDVKRVNSEGDTTVHIIGTIPQAAQWSSVDLISSVSSKGVGEDDVLKLVFRGSNSNTLIGGLLLLKDKHGVVFQAPMPSLTDEWRTAEFTRGDFSKAWQQPDSFNFDDLEQLIISYGANNLAGVIDLEVKEVVIEERGTAVADVTTKAAGVTAFVHSGAVEFTAPFTSNHFAYITDMRGRRIWSRSISKGTSLVKLPAVSRGVYILAVEGAEFNRAMKFITQ